MMQLFLKKPLMSMFLTMFFKTKKHFANDASNDVNRPPLVCRGGQLTLLDRRHNVLSFDEHRQKHFHFTLGWIPFMTMCSERPNQDGQQLERNQGGTQHAQLLYSQADSAAEADSDQLS